MTDIILGIGVGTFVVYAAFNIVYLVSMKRTSDRINAFLTNTEDKVNASLAEFSGTLQNLRKISGDIGAVTADVKEISDAVASVERDMRGVYGFVRDGLGSAAGANMAGLKAGISTGVATLVKSMQEVRRDDHERGTERKG
ncbi:MAG: DUF948 domain-containing protein [Nitrospirota bacterium]